MQSKYLNLNNFNVKLNSNFNMISRCLTFVFFNSKSNFNFILDPLV